MEIPQTIQEGSNKKQSSTNQQLESSQHDLQTSISKKICSENENTEPSLDHTQKNPHRFCCFFEHIQDLAHDLPAN